MKKQKLDFEEIFLRYDPKKYPVKTLFQLFRGNVGRFLLSIVFFIFKHSPAWITPLVTTAIINTAISPGDQTVQKIITYVFFGALIIAQNVPSHQAQVYFSIRVARDIEMQLRSALVRKLQHLTISFHKNFSSGRIQAKVLRDVDHIVELSNTVMVNIMQSLLSLVICAVITFLHSPTVSLFFLFTVPIAAILNRCFRAPIRTRVSEFRKEIEHMSANVAEMVEMIPVTKAHGLERVETRRMARTFEEVREKAVRTDTIQNLFGASAWAIMQIFQILCLGFTGLLAYKGKISVGEIALFQSYFSQLLGNVNLLISLYPMLSKGFESLGSISEILASDDIENNRGKKRLPTVEGAFEFKNVGFTYPDDPDAHVLTDFSLSVKKANASPL